MKQNKPDLAHMKLTVFVGVFKKLIMNVMSVRKEQGTMEMYNLELRNILSAEQNLRWILKDK